MAETKMTNRDFYEAIVNADVAEELKDFAAAALEKLDATNAARRKANEEKKAEKEAEKAPIREAVFGCITEEPKTASTLIEEAGVEIKPQAIPSLLKPLVEEGKVVKTEIKVTGKGKVRGYALA